MSDTIQPAGSADDPGLAGRGVLRALDLTDPKDVAMTHEAIRRWPKRWRSMSEEGRAAIVRGLLQGVTVAENLMDSTMPDIQEKGARLAIGAASVAAQMDRAELTQELALLDRLAPKPQAVPQVNVNVQQGLSIKLEE